MELKACHHLITPRSLTVSIAPLWNWKVYLKLKPLPLLLFQSHLYGIERHQSSLVSEVLECFNRTFMELKVASGAWLGLPPKFQSHLYGIESVQCNPTKKQVKVSIAPLWNWKFWGFGYLCLHHCFNRTFMELKVGKGLKSIGSSIVSIAPLWNWKITGKITYYGPRVFQSHLYGIESTQAYSEVEA